ncbi:hypothetical protein B0H21DRAFT_699704 [Amylocystis lapponica]|nr:hypothetical protein B0H21DRAFT_699704 [Amylocystis lapponica]
MSTLKITLPPLDETLAIFPHFVDFHAQHNPTRPFHVFPSPNPSSTNTIALSFLDFANATHRVAHIIRPGRAGLDGAVVAVLINADVTLYHALIVGLTRAGLIPFALSTRNSAAAIASMMERTECHRIISQPSLAPLTDEVRLVLPAGYEIQLDTLPALSEVFPSLLSQSDASQTDFKSYPPPLTPPSLSDIVLYIHSSGSAGFPKPIPQTHRTLIQWCTMPVLAEARARCIQWGAMALPPFHTMGVIFQLLSPLATGQFSAVFAPRAPAPPLVPTPQIILEAARLTRPNAMVGVPTFFETWAHNDEDIKFLASRDVVVFAGGPLSAENGARLVAGGVRFFALYGATEFGAVTQFFDTDDDLPVSAPNRDWEWMQIPVQCKPRWIAEGDGTYELQLITCPTHQPSIENFPNGEHGYATSDLFKPHPTKPGLWRIVGRKDDVIVMGSGEKTVPIPQETHIVGHPLVAGAVMFGRGRLQPGILIEPAPEHSIPAGDENALIGFRNLIWPTVEEANHPAPAFARIFKEMIVVTDPARPLVRVAKGTVQRKPSLALYEEDIEAAYQKVEDSADSHGIAPPASWAAEDVQVWLTEHAKSIKSGQTPVATKDIFEHGFDSLDATFLRNRVIGALRSSSEPAANAAAVNVQPNIIFANPTLGMLANAIAALVDPTAGVTSRSSIEELKAMIAKYTALLPQAPAQTYDRGNGGVVVFITGTTGSLGAHILAVLLAHPRISRVYAHNRGSNVEERQRAALEAANYPTLLTENTKLVLLSGDLMREDFGLPPAVLEEIRASVTHVIHNAWRVDFNLVLASFEPHIDVAVRLASLAPGIHFLFTSSVSAAQGWRPARARGPVPEGPLGDPAFVEGHGYGQSKLVVEEVLANAHKAGMKATTLRIGQISGSTGTGAWNTSEWVPSLIKSSVSLGGLPVLEGIVSWVPMDAVANATLDLLVSPDPPAYVNVVHPRHIFWPEVAAAINKELGYELPLVPLEDWVESLARAAEGASEIEIEAMPAIKVLEFFRGVLAWEQEAKHAQASEIEVGGLPIFETAKVQAASPTLRELQPLGEDDVRAWIKYWRQKGFLV